MKNLTVQEIREIWIKFFKEHNHYILEPKPIVPINDNSILFINSGVSTIKKYFDGSEVPPAKRLANIQKALRTNDIENVGVTSRHQTLFEMLGNFSIGDYFKSEAIDMALEFLTSPKYLDIDMDKLYFTVHPDDDVAYEKWISLNIDPKKIVKLEDNFWEIGNGPGGPNSEIFFDRGEEYDNRNVIELLEKDLENDRIIEIWNLVFSEFNCDPENKERKNYDVLPQQNIDTGMGLERIACILQDVETNFDTDEFAKIIYYLESNSKFSYQDNKKTYRIISDHIRALSFAIADGALPSNDGRGYVLRRILRRAVKEGYLHLDISEPFLYKLVDKVVEASAKFYPNLKAQSSFIKEVIFEEEQKFLKTIDNGLKLFNKEIAETTDVFSGEIAFLLYDTFGFPIELTIELAQAHNVSVDLDLYNTRLEEQRQRARNASSEKNAMSSQNSFLKEIVVKSEFIGYLQTKVNTKVSFITDLTKKIDSIDSGEAYVILEETPFYATSGGQVGDTGYINNNKVLDTIKLPNGQHAHLLKITDSISIGDQVDANIDENRRANITKNHSATHLLHKALHVYVSENAKQAGSLQDAEKTRFDFTSLNLVSNDKLREIEAYINQEINKDHLVETSNMSLKEAKEKNIMALFGEKYGDIVRVVKMGDSIELCGGTHVKSTKEINYFHILSETGIGSGIRRIEAITGNNVIVYNQKLQEEIDTFIKNANNNLDKNKLIDINELKKLLDKAQSLVATLDKGLSDKITILNKLITKNEEVKQENKKSQSNTITDIANSLITKIIVKDGLNYIEETINDIDVKALRELSDDLVNRVDNLLLILKLQEGNKVSVIVRVSENISKEHSANDIIKEVVQEFNGRGGGKPTFAQGGYQI